MALFIYPAQQVSITGGATEAKQDTIITELQQIETDIESGNTTATASDTKLGNIQTDIDELNARVAGNLVPESFNYIETTYVTVGNGIGEIETVVYKTGGSGGTTVATLTLAYDASNRLSSVTRS